MSWVLLGWLVAAAMIVHIPIFAFTLILIKCRGRSGITGRYSTSEAIFPFNCDEEGYHDWSLTFLFLTSVLSLTALWILIWYLGRLPDYWQDRYGLQTVFGLPAFSASPLVFFASLTFYITLVITLVYWVSVIRWADRDFKQELEEEYYDIRVGLCLVGYLVSVGKMVIQRRGMGETEAEAGRR